MTRIKVRCTGAHCNREIVWELLNGKNHPFDEVKHKRCGGTGKVEQLQATFDAPASGTIPCKGCHGTGLVLKSHFESCPDAAKFRKVKR